MVTILLTGIPGVGKSALIENAQAQSAEFYERDVTNISLGSLVAREANGLWQTPPERIQYVDDTLQAALRSYAISEAALQLERIKSPDQHIIIDTPLTLMIREGAVPVNTFDATHIAKLNRSRTIDYIITVIDNPETVAERLKESLYPRTNDDLLRWMAHEVSLAKSVLGSSQGFNTSQRTRHLVIPNEYSEETLTKLLNDPEPPICYFAFPITALHEKSDDSPETKEKKRVAREAISEFLSRLQEYCVVKVPIKIADLGATTPIEIENTVHRDKSWFVRNADFTLAFFPGEYQSTGVSEELRESIRLGKPTIVIHPQASSTDVFGIKTPLRYASAEEFFEAVAKSRTTPESRYDVLRRLLDPDNDLPRYAHLRDFSVAADFFKLEERAGKKDYLHLLGLRAKGIPGEHHWTLITGKRESDSQTGRKEKGTRALLREASEEAGIVFFEPEGGRYRIYKTDFGYVPYFRVYPVLFTPGMGKPTENYLSDPAEKKEIERLEWFTAEDVGKMEKVLPGTRRYFDDVMVGKVSLFPTRTITLP